MKMFRSQERSFKTQIVNVMPTHPLQRIEPADNPLLLKNLRLVLVGELTSDD